MQFISLKGCILAVVAIAASSLPASAASFEFNTLIRLGANGGGANWEIGAGNNSGAAPSITQNADTWTNGASREFQITYSRPSNSLEVRLFENGSSNSSALSYTPAGGPASIGATWTLPASSFFVTAVNGGNFTTAISVSSLSLTGLSGALTILSPMQQTTLQATSGFGLPTTTLRESQDIVFRGDSTGSWRLGGYVSMNFPEPINGGDRDLLHFGVSASAADVTATPEPNTWALLLAGFAVVAVAKRRSHQHRS